MKPPASGTWLAQKGNCFYVDAACASTATCVDATTAAGTAGTTGSSTSGGITSDQIKNYIVSHQDQFQAYYGDTAAGSTTGSDPEQKEMNRVWQILNKLQGWGN